METRPSVDTAQGKMPALPTFLVDGSGATLGGLFVTDLTKYPTKVDVNVDGADTDVLIAGEVGKRHFIYYGWLQPSGDVTLTFKTNATDLAPSIFVADKKALKIGDLASPLAEFITGVGEDFRVQKSAAVTLHGQLWKLTVTEPT